MGQTETTGFRFEHHYKERVMELFLPDGGYVFDNPEKLKQLKMAWGEALKKWHSPYSLLFDVRDLVIAPDCADDFKKNIDFFKKFFLKKIVGFSLHERNDLPFEVVVGYEEAAQKIGLARGSGLSRDIADLRQRIQIDNDFTNHVMEISFLSDTHFGQREDLDILKSKIQNILMQWHTPYSVLFNCVNVTFAPEMASEFVKIEKFLKAFFCKMILGYAPKGESQSYPFKMYRSRHLAAAELSHSGLNSGSEANCSTRKLGSS